jgi:hypothetical protein
MLNLALLKAVTKRRLCFINKDKCNSDCSKCELCVEDKEKPKSLCAYEHITNYINRHYMKGKTE